MNKSEILISVITVVFNSKKDLELTIRSVKAQKCKFLEYVIIDGGSSDGTLELIQDNRELVDTFLTEADEGIYHAMNKGLLLSKGKYVFFLNAGDTFHSSNSLNEIQHMLETDNSDILVFPVCIDYKGRRRIQALVESHDLWKGQFCHQGAIISRYYHLDNLYSRDFVLAADFELAYLAHLQGRSFRSLEKPLAVMSAGGVSDRQRLRSLAEKFRIVVKYNKSGKVVIFYIFSLMDALLRQVLKIMLPSKIVDRIVLSKYGAE